jgi:GTPase SAR1 family protein
MIPKVFIFVGHSGAGKTTLIEKLLRELSGRGLRVATIKHAHHKVVLDTPGKDSWRYKQAGAVMSMLVTSNELRLLIPSAGASRRNWRNDSWARPTWCWRRVFRMLPARRSRCCAAHAPRRRAAGSRTG